jgi:uncharacterized protein
MGQAMPLTQQLTQQTTIHRIEPGCIQIGDNLYHHSVIVSPQGVIAWQATTFDNLTTADIEQLLITTAGIDIVLLGTGTQQHFFAPQQLALLQQRQIDTMTSPAACRTYNLLLGDARLVTAAIIV